MSGFTDPNALAERVKAIPGGDMLMMCWVSWAGKPRA